MNVKITIASPKWCPLVAGIFEGSWLLAGTGGFGDGFL